MSNRQGSIRWGALGHVEMTDLDGQEITLQGSSLATHPYACRLYSNGHGVAHLTIEQARAIRDWLDSHIHTAETDPDE